MMRFIVQRLSSLLFILTMTISSVTQAHLLPAQHGTLNIIDNGAFLVLSLPISAFEGIDDDNDGKISMIAFNEHRTMITKAIREQVTLRDKKGKCPLQGILLSPEMSHHDFAPKAVISRLTVMGKFTLANPDQALHFHLDLYGKQTTEQMMKITATRQANKQKHTFELSPSTRTMTLFLEGGEKK